MPNKIFNALNYSCRYIIMVLIAHYIKKIGIESLYTINLLIIPFLNYLILQWGVIKVLNENDKITKKDIFLPFLLITTSFNIIFFYIEQFNTMTVFTIVFVNIVEFMIIKPKNESIKFEANKNIKEYFKSHPKKN